MARKLFRLHFSLFLGGLLFFLLNFIGFSVAFAATEAPPTPTNFQGEIKCVANTPQLSLSWDYDASANIKDYYIFKNQLGSDYVLANILSPASGNKVTWQKNLAASDAGKKITYYVEAENTKAYLSKPASITLTVPYCPVPSLSLEANCVGNTVTVNLSWTSSGHVNYFNIFRKIGTGSYSLINQLPGTVVSWEDRNLSSGQSYSYYIQAVGNGWDLTSSSVTAPTKNCLESTIPSPPPVLSASKRCVNGTGEIMLQWTSSLHTSYYTVKKIIGSSQVLTTNVSSGTFYPDKGSISKDDLGYIKPNTVYTYEVDAVGINGETVSSNKVSVDFTENCSSLPSSPTAPTNLTFSSRCQGVYPIIRLDWQPVSQAAGYYIFRKDPGETSYHYLAYARTDSEPSTSSFDYDDNTVLPDKIYSYEVEAANLAGVSSPVAITNVVVQNKCSLLPGVPTLLPLSSACDVNSNPVVNLKWSQSSMPDPNTGGFKIYQINVATNKKVLVAEIDNNNTFSYQDKNDATPVQSNVVYSYEIEAIGNIGQNPTFSNEESIKVGVCPLTAPTKVNFSQQSCSNTSRIIDLNWEGGNNAQYYQIYESTNPGDLGTKVADNIKVKNDEITTSNYGNLYFTVRAVGYDSNTKDSSPLEVAQFDCGSLTSAPTINLNTSQGECSGTAPYFHLSWQEVSNAVYYRIFRKQGLNGTEQLIATINDKTITFYDDHSVASGKSYYYRVEAYKNNDSQTSNYVLFSLKWCPPTAPANLKITQSCFEEKPSLSLSWQSSANTKDYLVFREDSPGALTSSAVPIDEVTTNSYIDKTAQNNQTYYYIIRAEGKDGVSSVDSLPLKVQTINCQPPVQVSSFTLEPKCDGELSEVVINWNNIAGSTYYQVYREKGSDLDSAAKLIADHLTNISYTDKSVYPGVTYVYGIKACNAGGCSSLSTPSAVGKSINVGWCAPTPPKNFTGSSASCDGGGHPLVQLTWTKDTSGNVDHYILKRSDGVILTNSLSGTASSFQDSFITKDIAGNSAAPVNNTTYTYTLIAVGHLGTETAQSNFTLKTHNCTLPDTPTITSIQGKCSGPFYYNEIKWQPVLDFSSQPQTKYYLVKRNGTVLFDSRNLIMGLSLDNILNNVTLPDSSVDNNIGTLRGSGFSLTPGKFNQALKLTGKGYICLDNHGCNWNATNPYFDNSFSKRTISLWFKANNVIGQQFLYDEGGTANGVGIYIKGGLLYAGAWSLSNRWRGKWIAAPIQANKWYNMVFVFDSTDKFLKLYLNGELKAQAVASASIAHHIDNDALGGVSQSSLILNGRAVYGGSYFSGLLDQASVWKTVLNGNQIKELYRGGIIPNFKQGIWDDFTAQGNAEYQYTIVAANANGNISASKTETASNIFCQPEIENLTLKALCTGGGKNQVTLTWDQPAPENISSYQIIRKDLDANTEQTLVDNLDSAATTYQDTFSAQDSHYQYEVIVQGKDGSSVKFSQNVTLNTCVALTEPPQLSSLQKGCQQFLPIVKLQWQNSPGAIYYEIFRNGKEIYDTRWNTAGYWPLTSDAKDFSTNNNNGSLVGFKGQPFQTVAGRTGLNFTGSQYVSIPASPSLNFAKNGASFTLESWVYFKGGLPGEIIAKESNYLLDLTSQGEVRWAIRGVVVPGDKSNFSNRVWIYKNTGAYVPLNKWAFVSLTYDKTAVKVYINGVLKSSIPAVQGYSDYNVYNNYLNNSIEIGKRSWGWTPKNHEYFHGLISQVKMAAWPESAADIQADYEATKDGGNYNLANPADVSSYTDYSLITAKNPWYANRSYSYYIEAFSQTSSLKGNSQIADFQSPQDICSSLKIENNSYSIGCSVNGPGDSSPLFYSQWYDFLPGNNVCSRDKYKLSIDDNLLNEDPYYFSYYSGDGGWGKARLDIRFNLQLPNSLVGSNQVKLQAENLKYGKFYSDPLNITVPDCSSPAAITNLAVKSQCKNGGPVEELSWDKDKTGYTNNYYIERQNLALNQEPSDLVYKGDLFGNVWWNDNNQGLTYAQGQFYSVNNSWWENRWYGSYIKDSHGRFYRIVAPQYINGLAWDVKNNCFWVVGRKNLSSAYRIYKINSSLNRVLGSFSVSSNNTNPRGIATDGTHLFVTDFNGFIVEYNLAGEKLKTMDVGALLNNTTHLTGITYWQNHLYVGSSNAADEAYKDYIYVIDPESSSQGFSLQAKINLAPSFPIWWSSNGWGVAGVATDGRYLYVTSHRNSVKTSLKKYALIKNGVKNVWFSVPAASYNNSTSTISYEDDYKVGLGKEYKYRIIAYGNHHTYNYSPWVTATAQGQCYNAPLPISFSLIKPTCNSSGQSYIEEKWQAMPENNYTDEYILMRRDQDGSEVERGKIPDDDFGNKSFSFTDTSYQVVCQSQKINGHLQFTCDDYTVQPGKTYKYYLIAQGPGGQTTSAVKPLYSLAAYNCSLPPEAPSITVKSGCVSGKFQPQGNISWARTKNTFQYNLYRACGSLGFHSVAIISDVSPFSGAQYVSSTDSLIYEDKTIPSNLDKGTKCSYYLKSVGPNGEATSSIASFNVGICGNTPAPAKNLVIQDKKCNQVTLDWDDTTPIGYAGVGPETAGEFEFDIYRAEGNSCSHYKLVEKIKPSGVGSRSYTDSNGLHEETHYCWKVAAVNPAGATFSRVVSLTTPKCPPGAFVLQAKLAGCGKVLLQWREAENYLGKENASAYEIYRSPKITNLTDASNLIATVPACDGGTNCVDYDAANKTYIYKDYYDNDNTNQSFPSGKSFYYAIKALPLSPLSPSQTTESTILKLTPCPALPTWKQVSP